MARDHTPVAVVTGGGSGIGKALCAVLAREGWSVAVADRDAAAAETVAREVGGFAHSVDVADETSVGALFAAVAAKFGRLDGLATSAGVVDTTPFADISVATFERVHAVNVIGTFLCIREAAKKMQRGGRMCTVASVAGKRGGGLSGTAAYAASKGAVLALSRSAARSLAAQGITVNCVAPGATLTPMLAERFNDLEHRRRVEGMTLLGRSAEPAEIAEAIAWLLSPRSSFVAGETLTIDGGLMLD
ncbi:MAG: SDR family oxidoreductase [Candidatus Eremiobacteraeota bacterium]|nr:SDR family oxidoreductase [Candidatus Eremiobacteraeota bacterium]